MKGKSCSVKVGIVDRGYKLYLELALFFILCLFHVISFHVSFDCLALPRTHIGVKGHFYILFSYLRHRFVQCIRESSGLLWHSTWVSGVFQTWAANFQCHMRQTYISEAKVKCDKNFFHVRLRRNSFLSSPKKSKIDCTLSSACCLRSIHNNRTSYTSFERGWNKLSTCYCTFTNKYYILK